VVSEHATEDGHPLDWFPEPISDAEREAWSAGDPADSLALIDRARAALAKAETLPDIGAVREIAERARRYASAAKLGRAAENHAARVRIEAERKAGTLLAAMDRQGRGRPDKSEAIADLPPPTLPDLGITHRQSSDWQRIARIPAPVFEQHVEEVTKAGKALTTDGIVKVARQIEREIRAAEPKPIVPLSSIPARIEVADARSLPLEDETVDLIVTSPPYALDVAYEDGDVSADDWPGFMHDWLLEALRVTKEHGRLALNVPLDTTRGGCRPTYAEAVMAALEAGWTYKATIVWHENNTTTGNRGLGSVNSSARPHPVDSSEMIALLSKGEWGPSSSNPDTITPDDWQRYGRGPWTFSGESRAWENHPAPFPEELPRRLIRYLCRRGDVVLDPFSGSGTTVAVAVDEGRMAIGFDISEAYVLAARRRVATCAA
jgi:DNA modification methylase